MTLTVRILAYVRRYPGRTAWGISVALTRPKDDPRFVAASTSSILKRKADAGVLRREAGKRGAWTYWPAPGWKAK